MPWLNFHLDLPCAVPTLCSALLWCAGDRSIHSLPPRAFTLCLQEGNIMHTLDTHSYSSTPDAC